MQVGKYFSCLLGNAVPHEWHHCDVTASIRQWRRVSLSAGRRWTFWTSF